MHQRPAARTYALCLVFVVFVVFVVFAACGSDDSNGREDLEAVDTATDAPNTADTADTTETAAPEVEAEVEVTPGPDNEALWDWSGGGFTPTDYTFELDPDGGAAGGTGAIWRVASLREDTLGGVGLGATVPVDGFLGQRVKFTARLRSEGVTGGAWLAFGVEVGATTYRFVRSSINTLIIGDTDWTTYQVELDVDPAATGLFVSVDLLNAGEVWLDEARLEAVPAEGPDDDMFVTGPTSFDAEGPVDELGLPRAWWLGSGSPFLYELRQTTEVSHSGEASMTIASDSAIASDLGMLVMGMHVDAYRGRRVRLSSWIRTADVPGTTQMWFRIDGFSRLLGFDNMDDRPVTGTTEWAQHAIVLDVPDEAIMFFFGVFQAGPGTTWFDDFTLEIVDESVPTTP